MLVKSSILKYEDAVSIYNSFDNKLKINTLSPIYANVDSYRDPNIQKTFDAFYKSITWSLKSLTKDHLEEGILNIIKDIFFICYLSKCDRVLHSIAFFFVSS